MSSVTVRPGAPTAMTAALECRGDAWGRNSGRKLAERRRGGLVRDVIHCFDQMAEVAARLGEQRAQLFKDRLDLRFHRSPRRDRTGSRRRSRDQS